MAMEHETQAVEAGSASALRTGGVCKEISEIAQRSAELAHAIAQASVDQSAGMEEVSAVIKEFSGEAASTQRVVQDAQHTVEEMAKLAKGLTAAVGRFKLA